MASRACSYRSIQLFSEPQAFSLFSSPRIMSARPSFTSVSLEPPLVLWCIDRRSRRYPHFAQAPGFTVSILASGHRELSTRLARAGEHNLDGIALIPTELGPPALADSLAIFECARESVQDAGDHAILIGRVLRFARHDAAGAPLVYFRGRYGALAQGETS